MIQMTRSYDFDECFDLMTTQMDCSHSVVEHSFVDKMHTSHVTEGSGFRDKNEVVDMAVLNILVDSSLLDTKFCDENQHHLEFFHWY